MTPSLSRLWLHQRNRYDPESSEKQIWPCLNDSDDICDPQWRLKLMSEEFPTVSLDITTVRFINVLTFLFGRLVLRHKYWLGPTRRLLSTLQSGMGIVREKANFRGGSDWNWIIIIFIFYIFYSALCECNNLHPWVFAILSRWALYDLEIFSHRKQTNMALWGRMPAPSLEAFDWSGNSQTASCWSV